MAEDLLFVLQAVLNGNKMSLCHILKIFAT